MTYDPLSDALRAAFLDATKTAIPTPRSDTVDADHAGLELLFSSDNRGCHSRVGRMGRGANPPPQFGHTLCRTRSTQSAQNVHS